MTDLYRPKYNKNNFNTIGRYSKFMNQFHDPNDWGFKKQHVYSWERMNDNMVELNTYKNNKHQLKASINYHYTYTKGKPFGAGKNKRIAVDSRSCLLFFSPKMFFEIRDIPNGHPFNVPGLLVGSCEPFCKFTDIKN